MLLRFAHSLRLALALLTLGLGASAALGTTALAAEPTFLEQLQAVSRSMDEVTKATIEVVDAQSAYDAQLALVQQAARELAAAFAEDDAPAAAFAEDDAPAVTTPGSHKLIDELLAPFTPTPQVAPQATRVLDLLSLKPSAPSRLQQLQRASDPNGTSIYDSLVFHD